MYSFGKMLPDAQVLPKNAPISCSKYAMWESFLKHINQLFYTMSVYIDPIYNDKKK